MDIKIYKADDVAPLPVSGSRTGLRVVDSNLVVGDTKAKLKKTTAMKKNSDLPQIQQMRAQIVQLQKEKQAEILRVDELRNQNLKLKADGVKMYNMYQAEKMEIKQLGAQYDKLKEYTLEFEEDGLLLQTKLFALNLQSHALKAFKYRIV